jgi:cell division protein FtsA
MALHTPLQVAENVKVRHGSLIESSNEIIELPIIGDEESRNGVSLEVVHSVIFSRVEEALMILSKSLEKSALKEQIGAGIILTGGMTKLKGMRELAQAIFTGMPVRVGYPDNVNGLFDELKDPAFSTVVGLLLYKAGGHTQYEINFQQELLHSKATFEDNLSDIRIGHAANHSEEAQASRAHKEEKEHKQQDQEASDISFNDLPDLGHENKNPFKKLASWARQLF